MKLARFLGSSRVEVGDAPVPVPAADEVLVRTQVSALCGSELKKFAGEVGMDGNMGHEAAGVVERVGSHVKHLKPGTRVGASAIAGCGACPDCRAGRYTWCPERRFFANMHAEYFVVPALACQLLPDDLDWEVGVLISGDGLGVPFHTSTKLDADSGTHVAVFGLGPIGLGNVLMQRFLGRTVIAIDLSEDRLALADALGAAHLVDARTDAVAAVRRLTDGRGADVCIEAAGLPVTAKQCFAAVRTNGIVIFNGEQPSVELSPSDDFIRRDIRAVGSWFYHFAEFAEMLRLYRAGLAVESLVTHRFEHDHIGRGYELMAAGKSGKVLITYESTPIE